VNQHSNGPVYTPATVAEALEPAPEGPTETMKKQRSVSKLCVAAVQRVDGYKYSFHNNWKSGEENAFRFSYYCNDSLLNKDRVANGKAGTQGMYQTYVKNLVKLCLTDDEQVEEPPNQFLIAKVYSVSSFLLLVHALT
jgi:hypothetical protein